MQRKKNYTITDLREYSHCVACGEGFWVGYKNKNLIVSSPDYGCYCHKDCCGMSDMCMSCSIFKSMKGKSEVDMLNTLAIKSMFNILVPTVQAMSNEQLKSLEDVVLYLGPLIAAEQDKRDGFIISYSLRLDNDNMCLLIKR